MTGGEREREPDDWPGVVAEQPCVTVWGLGFGVSSFEFLVSGFGFSVWLRFGVGIWGLEFGVWSLGFGVSGSVFGWDLGFGV